MRYRLAKNWRETWEKEHGQLSQAETLVVGYLAGRRDWHMRLRMRSIMAAMPWPAQKTEALVAKLLAKGYLKTSIDTRPRIRPETATRAAPRVSRPPPIDVRARLTHRSQQR
jgi:hypothetical protein